jgi:hypothetical protein
MRGAAARRAPSNASASVVFVSDNAGWALVAEAGRVTAAAAPERNRAFADGPFVGSVMLADGTSATKRVLVSPHCCVAPYNHLPGSVSKHST